MHWQEGVIASEAKQSRSRAAIDRAGGMAGVGDADRKISAGDFAAGVARIYFLGALPFQSHA